MPSYRRAEWNSFASDADFVPPTLGALPGALCFNTAGLSGDGLIYFTSWASRELENFCRTFLERCGQFSLRGFELKF